MSSFTIKRGDTSPAIESTLRDGSGSPVDLDGSSVLFRMRDENGDLVVDEVAYIDLDETGVVVYEWQSEDTADSGVYRAEWQVTYDDGAVETFPNSGYLTIYVNNNVE